MNETELAFCEILNCDRASLYIDKDSLPDKDKSEKIASVLKRRALGEPIQYILGKAEFLGLEFRVTPDVLIPRPETEVLSETAIRYVTRSPLDFARGKQGHKDASLNILELGTGSGCVAISLAKSLPQAKITATDISQKVLVVAKENALLNRISNIDFIQSDLFSHYGLWTVDYGLIAANPPYIPTTEINKLQPELQYEPRIALDGGKDGLDFYRRIVKDAADYLIPEGYLIMEMGFGRSEAVKNIILNSQNFEIMEIVKDYNNISRVVVAKRIK